jgi:hypothetical protein
MGEPNSKIINPDGTERTLRQIWGRPTGRVIAPMSTKSIFFDGDTAAGQSDHVLIGDYDDFSFTDGAGNDKPFSFSVWAFITDVAASNGPFVTKAEIVGGSSGETEYIFKHANGELRTFLYTSLGTANRIKLISNATALTNATWHNIIFTYNGNKDAPSMNYYVDGSAVASTPGADGNYQGMVNTSQPLLLGNTNNEPPAAGQAFEDQMADVVIFNKELTATEALEIFGGTAGVAGSGRVKDMNKFSDTSSIISWWQMGDGDTSATSGIVDSIGSFNGTLENGAKIINAKNLKSDYITKIL